ncbi:MAG: helix-turn-helix transcriptional regulator [Lachnospiraceae bacterium]|nr:helix-turn-helix transcriptional regulator [Lachnospiraceae bacterium]MDO5550551.1 helix-turn-helix transcriptional regulator [Lachnospiraceae bacterium]
MPRDEFQSLTEQMYYILLALLMERCGVEIVQRVSDQTDGRLVIGPGTLYALLERFQQCGMIRETRAEGRRRYYKITASGRKRLQEEYGRLRRMAEDGKEGGLDEI